VTAFFLFASMEVKMSQVSLIVGHKGSGKTKMMLRLANDRALTSDGRIIFVNKNKLIWNIKHSKHF